MDTKETSMYDWRTVPWREIERNVFKLQKRIYQARKRGEVDSVHKLQRLLVRSRSAKLLAVRRVTQDNQGKKTAGVDGVKSLNYTERMNLVNNLSFDEKALPTRRVWIPKPGTDEKRPLGIPTMEDRVKQSLLKLALEPEWEAVFEPHSYGFRPGRSCHDAINAIHQGICLKPKFVLDADIAKCFDRIDHEALLDKLNTTPEFRRTIKMWLKAGFLDGDNLFPTEEGTPQGGVISPLLANIALHGMMTEIENSFQGSKTLPSGKRVQWQPIVIRYADDFVILHEDLDAIKQAKEVAANWLKGMGLELKPSKTRIVHTLNEHEGQKAGFDFLGFQILQHEVGKTKCGKKQGRPLGFKTLTKPSVESLKRHQAKLKEVIRQNLAAPQQALIAALNKIIKGWTNYFRTSAATKAFSKMDYLLFAKLQRWAKRRHPQKSKHWISSKYWTVASNDKWDFATKDGVYLHRHVDTSIKRHVKVRGEKSPYDGEWSYWATRLGEHPEVPKQTALLLKKQKGKCLECGLLFKDGDIWAVDHKVPTTCGGKDEWSNYQLLHKHCHDQKSARDGSHAASAGENS